MRHNARVVTLSAFGIWPPLLLVVLLAGSAHRASAAANETSSNQVARTTGSKPLAAVLPPAKWQQVEASVDRALAWMATQQTPNGSFQSLPTGQPGVTSLAAMAYLSRGHQPGLGPYGEPLNKALDFVLSCQMSNGLITLLPPGPVHQDKMPSHTAIYNHAISALMLGEVYGQVSGQRAKAVKQAIGRALQFSRELQTRPKRVEDRGGWRYIRVYHSNVDSDLSVTGWHLMFLRSAKNAEFDVPQTWVDDAVSYVRRLWDPTTGAFNYELYENVGSRISRAMTGAGILCLSMGGQHQSPMARTAGDWLLAHPFKVFGELVPARDRFFYGAYYCSQAMAQLGGRYWEQFFPVLADTLVNNQTADGSWPPEVGGFAPTGGEAVFGQVYSTSLAVLSLTPPYQLLPVYQR